jgi:hypothetical protein
MKAASESMSHPAALVEVLVVGGGVTGSSIAYHVARQGRTVLVVERTEVAVEPAASWASAGGKADVRFPLRQISQPSLIATRLTPQIINSTSSQAVTSHTIQLTFKYCLMSVDRPWLSQAFLSLPNWQVTGYQAGAFSTGTAQNNPGFFPALPVVFLAIKDLQITADWTESDVSAARQSAALGPFSLLGRTIDDKSPTLSCNGLQIIGWICQIMPDLPPNDSPAPMQG